MNELIDPFNKDHRASHDKILKWRKNLFLFCDEMLNFKPAEPLEELKGKEIDYVNALGEKKKAILFDTDGRLVWHDLSFYSMDMFKWQSKKEFKEHPNMFTWQQTVEFEAYDRGINTFDKDSYDIKLRRITIRSGNGIGKLEKKTTPILVVENKKNIWKTHGQLKVGDIIHSTNELTKITGVYPQGIKDIYRVSFDDGGYLDVGEEHLWAVKGRQERERGMGWVTLTTKQIIERGVKRANGTKHRDRQFEIPRMLITNGRKERGVYLNKTKLPQDFLSWNIESRKDLLKGLCDTGGTIGDKGNIEFSTIHKGLAEDVVILIRSLGGKARITTKKRPKFAHKRCYRISFQTPFNPFAINKRNYDLWKMPQERYLKRWIDKIELVGKADTQCIKVSAKNQLYVSGKELVVTHNTSFASVVSLHFLICFYFCQIGATASNEKQLKDVYMKELYVWVKKLPEVLRSQLVFLDDKIKIKTENEKTEWFLRAKVAGKDNPEALCFDEDTDILTKTGWRGIKNVKKGEFVLTQDLIGGNRAKWTPVLETYKYKGEHKGYEYISDNKVMFRVTEDHRFPVWEYKGGKRQPIQYKKVKDFYYHSEIPVRVDMKLSDTYHSPLDKYTDEQWTKFIAVWISDGNKKGNYLWVQQEQGQRKFVEDLLIAMGVEYTGDWRGFLIKDKELTEIVIEQCGELSLGKKIPEELITSKVSRVFLDTYLLFDGAEYTQKNGHEVKEYYTINHNIADGIMRMLVLNGERYSSRIRKPKVSVIKSGKRKGYKIHSKKPLYEIRVIKSKNLTVKRHNLRKVTIKDVYCVSVKEQVLVTRFKKRDVVLSCNSGIHAPYVLLFADEASAIFRKVFEMMGGSLTGENYIVIMTSNPTRTEGYFYDSHKKENKTSWTQLHFDSRDSPIVQDGFVQGFINDYGLGSDEYLHHVTGEFASVAEMDDKGWIPLFANMNILFEPAGQQIIKGAVIGVDPAGQGKDYSIITVRDNIYLKEVLNEATSSELDLARKVETIVSAYSSTLNDVGIDAFGIGAKVINHIHTKIGEMPNALLTDKPREEVKDQYNSYKSELAWKFRQWVAQGGIIITNNEKEWLRELSLIKYKRDLQGRIKLMGKVEFKKENGFSPDRFDACCYTFFRDEPTSPVIFTKEDIENKDWADYIKRMQGGDNMSMQDLSSM